MATKSFKQLEVWKKSVDFSVEIYRLFSNCKDYSFKDQIQRATTSICNNIAEGYGRGSTKALKNYFLIAKGSAIEVESMLILASRIGYINASQEELNIAKVQEIQKMLSGYIKRL